MLYAYSAPWLGRVLARRGDPGAGDLLDAAWAQAQRQHQLLGMAYAGIARAEWAWLTGDVAAAQQVADVLLPLTQHPGATPFRAELLRYLARGPGGVGDGPRDGGLPRRRRAYDLGLRGDWRGAAAAWRRAGDPYETALELGEGDADACATALRTLERLGARARGRDRPRAPA